MVWPGVQHQAAEHVPQRLACAVLHELGAHPREPAAGAQLATFSGGEEVRKVAAQPLEVTGCRVRVLGADDEVDELHDEVDGSRVIGEVPQGDRLVAACLGEALLVRARLRGA